MTGSITTCATIARKNLLLERRVGEALLVTAPLGATALLVIPIAVGTNVPLLRQVGPGMYWVVVLLFGVLVVLRQSALETPAQSRMLALAGVPATVRLLGNAMASTVLLLAFGAVLAPITVLLYDQSMRGWPWLLVVLPVVAAGLALLGSVAEAVLASLDLRTTLGTLLMIPLALPLLLGATQILEAAAADRTPVPWLLLVVTADLVLLLAAMFAGHLLEDAR